MFFFTKIFHPNFVFSGYLLSHQTLNIYESTLSANVPVSVIQGLVGLGKSSLASQIFQDVLTSGTYFWGLSGFACWCGHINAYWSIISLLWENLNLDHWIHSFDIYVYHETKRYDVWQAPNPDRIMITDQKNLSRSSLEACEKSISDCWLRGIL